MCFSSVLTQVSICLVFIKHEKSKASYIAYGQRCPDTEMKVKEFRDFIIGNKPVEPILLEILVQETMNIMDRETKHSNFGSGMRVRRKRYFEFGRNLVKGSTLARFEDEFGVSSYDLEHSGYRRTFSRHKDYMLANWMIKTLPKDFQKRSGRRWVYYNTTPLGKVLAMKYWYNEFLGKKPLFMKTNEIVVDAKKWKKFSNDKKEKFKMDIRQSYGEGQILDDGRLGIEIKPDDLLISFFQFLQRLKKFSDDIKKAVRGLGPKEALQFTFPEIDINYSAPINRVAIEVKFRLKYQTHVQIIKYFKLDDREDVKKLYYYILDSLTYLFLANLEAEKEKLDVENPIIVKILNDPDLKSFRRQYQMDTKQVLQESLNFLSDDS